MIKTDADPNQNHQVLFDTLRDAIFSYDETAATAATQTIIDRKIDPIAVMDGVVADTAKSLGDKFESGEIFIPHLVMGGDILAVVATQLTGALPEGEATTARDRIVVIATVESDVHSIGKNIVAMLLKANGFEVHDIGVDVPSETIIDQAERFGAGVIALSSLLTTTMPYQKEVLEDLERMKLRDQFLVVVGGGPVTQNWADEIQADGYAKDAVAAVDFFKALSS